MNNNIVIVGAGASGLFCSIELVKKNYNVTVIEKNSKAGRKILASGNGKCNITNENLSYKYFHSSSNQNFFKHAISLMPFKKIKTYFSSIGLEIIKGEGTRMYPMSLQASSVKDVLYEEAINLGVRFEFNSEVTNIVNKNNVFTIKTEENSYQSKYLILANGSSAMKKLGSNSSGYKFAKEFGHTIIEPVASLVQLKSNDKSVFSITGVKIKTNVKLLVNNKLIQEEYGDVLFTKYGLSGNTVLDLSRNAAYAIRKNKKVDILIDLINSMTDDDLFILLLNRYKIINYKKVNFLLESIINSKLIPFVYKKANINVESISMLDENDIKNIVYVLKNIKVNISDTNGQENAEICAGGVDVNEVDEYTMKSKKCNNLYFCGEILDVDGSCGGYNFHWAWSSANCLAKSFK